MYDYLLSATESFIRYGISPTALIVAIVALFKTKKAKRLISRRLPWLFRDESDVLQYQDRQKRIEKKLDAIAEHLGVPPCGQYETLTNGVQSLKQSSKPSRAVTFLVDQLKEMTKMKKWIRPDKLAIIFGVLATAANEFLGTDIESGNIAAFFIIMFTYLKQNEIVNITRYAHGLPVEFKVNSTKLWFTLVGLALTFYATYTGEIISQETIITIAGIISGYNVYEGKKDVQEAQKEAEGNHYR